MKKSKRFFLFAGIIIITLMTIKMFDKNNTVSIHESGLKPNEWLFRQRAYPTGKLDHQAYRAAFKFKKKKQANSSLSSSLEKNDNPWEFKGPFRVEGRITDIEMTSTSPQTIFVGAASGGIFKSNDMGENWTPIFDENMNLSIGDLALAPSDESIIYVGTGEANAGGGSLAYDGTGVYKSINGGDSWTGIGLEDVGSIGKVVVNPLNPDICFVAAMGHLFENNENRGLFRTKDGGDSWEKVLFINDSTGVIDIAINPNQPKVIYAATWERIRRVDRRSYGGPSSGIYRSTNGGDSWTKLSNGLPEAAGRIGIAIAESNPDILYAIYANEITSYIEGIYKTNNEGNDWSQVSSEGVTSVPYMWWFGKIYVDPADPDLVYIAGFNNHKSTNGGSSWTGIFNGVHVDQHAICINPLNNNMIFSGNDGGLFVSQDQGATSNKINGLPITQFYTCEMDYSHPERVFGGAQDNGTIRTLEEPDQWTALYGGDGFRCLVDPENSNIIYAEYQYGNLAKSTNGGSSFSPATTGISNTDRFNWNTAVIIDPTSSSTLYYGTNRLYKSTDKAETWTPISPDLSGNPPQFNLRYGTITSISVSPVNNNIIWVGTDDGKVQVTHNGGNDWTLVSGDLPKRWITSVFAAPNDESTAYVTFSGYRNGLNEGHIYQTNDLGENWLDISGDLPDIPINDVIVTSDGHIHIATDIGAYYRLDEGETWEILGQDLPNVVITDLTYHAPGNTLLAATYGRGMFQLSLGPGAGINTLQDNLHLTAFPIPFSRNVQISFNSPSSELYAIQVFDASGKLVHQEKTRFSKGQSEKIIELNQLSSGFYYCKINNLDQSLNGTIKLIKR